MLYIRLHIREGARRTSTCSSTLCNSVVGPLRGRFGELSSGCIARVHLSSPFPFASSVAAYSHSQVRRFCPQRLRQGRLGADPPGATSCLADRPRRRRLARCTLAALAAGPEEHARPEILELVALLGAPQQIKSDGVRDVWQYCRDFLDRNARYYIAVMIEEERVQAVRPYPVASRAGCEDFYRTGF